MALGIDFIFCSFKHYQVIINSDNVISSQTKTNPMIYNIYVDMLLPYIVREGDHLKLNEKTEFHCISFHAVSELHHKF